MRWIVLLAVLAVLVVTAAAQAAPMPGPTTYGQQGMKQNVKTFKANGPAASRAQ